MSKALAITGNAFAFIVYGVGLLSPLTPSTGLPALSSLATFVGLPLVLLLIAWRGYTHRVAKYAVVLQSLCVLVFTGWLLLIQIGAFANAS